MRDIEIKDNAEDARVQDTQLFKAKNVIDVQLGSLNYAKDFGTDKRFFIDSDFNFSTATFASHVMERLATSGIPASIAVAAASQFADALKVNVERTS